VIDLDSNVIIALVSNRSQQVRKNFDDARLRKTSMSVSVIVLHELLYGAVYSANPVGNEKLLNVFISRSRISIIDFTPADAEQAADIRAHLRSQRTPIGPFDCLIAAQARRRGVPLVTANVREFQRVPGLVVVDWTL
jgi:tRNA(fMet)-specific endonuclease VapC